MFLITLEEILVFVFFVSVLVASLIPDINNPKFSGDLAIFIISFISSFEINNAVVPDQ